MINPIKESRIAIMNRGLKILVVDDDDENQRILEIILKRLGHNVLFASNGSEAVEIVKSQQADFVLMDVQMPVMDGIEATRQIREWEDGKAHLPIVGVTAVFNLQHKSCLQIGMDYIISKPYDISKFQEVIEVCTGYKSTAETRSVDSVEPQPTDPPILDVSGAVKRFAGDRENYLEILNDFSLSLPGRLEELINDFTAGGWQSLSDHAHNLKGLSASLGAIKLSRNALELEQQIKAGWHGNVEVKLNEIGDNISALQSMISKLLEHPQGGSESLT